MSQIQSAIDFDELTTRSQSVACVDTFVRFRQPLRPWVEALLTGHCLGLEVGRFVATRASRAATPSGQKHCNVTTEGRGNDNGSILL